MDVKLANYRAEKRKKRLLAKVKSKLNLWSLFGFGLQKDNSAPKDSEVLLGQNNESESIMKPLSLHHPHEDQDEEEDDDDEEMDPADVPIPKQTLVKWLLYLLLWAVLFFIFVELQFGAVYFAVSLLVGMFLNTRTRRKKPGELSAYSVFNKNCQSIHGTVSADDLQRQMLFGGIGIR